MKVPVWLFAAYMGIALAAPPSKPLAGVVIVCSDGQRVVTDAQGRYSLTVSTPFTGSVTPAISGYSFAPLRATFTSLQSNMTMVADFKAKKRTGSGPFDSLLKWLGIK